MVEKIIVAGSMLVSPVSPITRFSELDKSCATDYLAAWRLLYHCALFQRSLDVGKRPRSQSERRHQHVDFTVASDVRSENDLFEIIEQVQGDPLVLILDGVQDPHNLGACLRSAEAAGAHAVIVPRDRAVGLTDVARLAAAGAAERIPLVQVTNLARTMKALKDSGLWLVGTADQAKSSLYDVDLAGPLGLVMGTEGKGLRRLTAERCDFLVKIPMHGKVGCLNVSVATGVCLFEAVRQRTARASNRK